MTLFDAWSDRRRGARPEPDSGAPFRSPVEDDVFTTVALGRFLDCLAQRDAPVVLDLGTLVGDGITILGEELGCKLLVEDIFADLDRLATEMAPGEDPDAEQVVSTLATRIDYPPASVDGILCWDALEHMTPAAAEMIGRSLVRLLRPQGVILVTFGPGPRQEAGHTSYEIVSRTQLRYRFHRGAARQTRVLSYREVTRIFEALTIAGSFLLKSQRREMLFRKPRLAGDAARASA